MANVKTPSETYQIDVHSVTHDSGRQGIILSQDEDVIYLTTKQAKSLIFKIIDALPESEKRDK